MNEISATFTNYMSITYYRNNFFSSTLGFVEASKIHSWPLVFTFICSLGEGLF